LYEIQDECYAVYFPIHEWSDAGFCSISTQSSLSYDWENKNCSVWKKFVKTRLSKTEWQFPNVSKEHQRFASRKTKNLERFLWIFFL